MNAPSLDRLVWALVAALALLGLWLVTDYGLSWDEPQQRLIGQVAFNHVSQTLFPGWIAPFPDVQPLHHFRDRDYGVVFELPTVVLERLFRLTDTREIYFMRHYLTFLVFLAGVMAMYRLGRMHCNSAMAGLLAASMLLLSPRFFAEAFYNSKDVVFMALFAIAMATLFRLLREPTVRNALIHALASALAVDVRIMGLLLAATTLLAISLLIIRGFLAWPQGLKITAIYVLSSCLLIILMFPFLWADPWGNLLIAFANMSQFGRWGGDVLYFGQLISGENLPWHYAPIWISITTPPIILALLVIGVVATVIRLLRNKLRLWAKPFELEALIALGLLTAPIAAVIVLDSVLYNGWRQLYFVYPALLLLATRGAYDTYQWLNGQPALRYGFAAVLISAAIVTGQWMVRAHPMQNVYFNNLVGDQHKTQFELDYWGLANREALEFLLDYQPSGPIQVRAKSFTPLEFSALILRPSERDRLDFDVDHDKTRYLVNNYYGWQRHGNLLEISDAYLRIHDIVVTGEVILSIYEWQGSDDNTDTQ